MSAKPRDKNTIACLRLAALCATVLLSACSGEEAAVSSGTITLRAYGESFIEDGIPAADVDDGWSISFERFDVSLQDIVVADVPLEDPEPVDVSVASSGKGHAVGNAVAPAGDHRDASFTIARVHVEGAAEKDGTTKTFDWSFESPTHYSHCDTTTQLEPDGKATFQITIHADHLFYDSLVAEEPQLLFGAMADADADDDGQITQAELARADIGSYDPGNADEIDDMWSFLLAQHRTLGHVDGEGHCEATATE